MMVDILLNAEFNLQNPTLGDIACDVVTKDRGR